MIETERLRLSELGADDAAFILELVNEPGWLANIGDKGVRNLDDARRYIADGPQVSYVKFDYGLYRVALKADAASALGICGLVRRETLTDADIGFAFLQRFWGNGYALEAAAAVLADARDRLRLPRVVAITAPENHGSIRVLETIGLRFVRMIELPGHATPTRFFAIEF